MTTFRRAKQREHDGRRKYELWLTFPPGAADELNHGFGTLESLNEAHLAPGAGVARHRHHDAEIITYAREGALAYEDSMGRSGVIQTGEFQRMTAGRGIRHLENNASRIDRAQVFQMGLRSWRAGLDPGYEQKRFSAAERRDGLCVVASPDGRRGSLRLQQDALVYSAILDPGQHVVHELSPGRRAWLHLVQGEVVLGEIVLTAGDGAGLTGERAVSLTAREETEILLLDLGVEQPGPPGNEHVA
jgi:quercetin 2,3-dioxygenase